MNIKDTFQSANQTSRYPGAWLATHQHIWYKWQEDKDEITGNQGLHSIQLPQWKTIEVSMAQAASIGQRVLKNAIDPTPTVKHFKKALGI